MRLLLILALIVTTAAHAELPQKICPPAGKLDFWNLDYRIIDVPPAVSSYPKLIVWKGKPECGGAVQAQFYSESDAWNFIKAKLRSDADMQAYRDSQPTTPLTSPEWTWKQSILLLWTPRAEVQHQAAPDNRPVYKLKADGTRNTTAVTGIRVAGGSRCDLAKRVGTTNYYQVVGTDTNDKPLAAGLYAVCLPIDPWK